MKKGSMSIQKVAAIVLGVAVIVLIITGVQGWFDTLAQDFLSAVEY